MLFNMICLLNYYSRKKNMFNQLLHRNWLSQWPSTPPVSSWTDSWPWTIQRWPIKRSFSTKDPSGLCARSPPTMSTRWRRRPWQLTTLALIRSLAGSYQIRSKFTRLRLFLSTRYKHAIVLLRTYKTAELLILNLPDVWLFAKLFLNFQG